ncbi:UDP-N-acetylglucosamine--undecaprenyl-phosphate N-acetylglucosaminephosphotransferase [Corallincola spongiicola]|uniref:Undecaprenyl-phosphate alpha-N-acetylglucosaminyl 1-phosphate transferase n=1 Tax=Corallincola spongiicola TaxID=2520508 RepID=A0ABY1WKG4_9GAMM|nr:UDP-N-acetylglucosamine--undecaprenyl-phosphate N-acetylglucosaminephosphotransferase [Corallincola spongiicola]TAA39581.1 undecaprenyl-phosphate alpha-N-acetylglucosaminyl 1-phosphate transferase [Corallincola spongiicola]
MDITLSLFTAFLCSFLSIKILKPLAEQVGLVDKPNERKNHVGHIPLVGGISTFIGVLIASVLWLPHSSELRIYIIASAMMVFIGVLDDKYDLSVRVRLVGQMLIASLMIFGVNAYIADLGDLIGFGGINLGWLGIPFTYLAMLGAINAFNMVDGIDGLVGSLSITTFTSLALLFLFNSDKQLATFPLMIATATFPYLLFNLGLPGGRFKKIFMGDAGSMFIGLSVVWLLATGSQGDNAAFRPVTALWVIAMPLMDMAAIMYRRMKKGQSPFKPDRDHLHHIFMRAGFSARQSLLIITILAVVLAGVGIVGELLNASDWLMFVGFLGVFVLYCYSLQHIWRIVSFIRHNVTHEQ